MTQYYKYYYKIIKVQEKQTTYSLNNLIASFVCISSNFPQIYISFIILFFSIGEWKGVSKTLMRHINWWPPAPPLLRPFWDQGSNPQSRHEALIRNQTHNPPVPIALQPRSVAREIMFLVFFYSYGFSVFLIIIFKG